MFNAILIDKPSADGPQQAQLAAVDDGRLPAGEVTVRIAYSTLNYKDALAITGKAPIVRSVPMVPGIDFAGRVEHSDDPRYAAGDAVLLNGWGVGERHWGGLAQRARVPGEWLLPIPPPLTARDAMALGTAGYTAMLCVGALQRHGLKPADGPVLVTGANGGVGSYAIALLSRLGHPVIAATGRTGEADYLRTLGASEVLDRAELGSPGKPLGKERWAGAVDTAGSHTLANVLAGTRYGGAVAACGLAQGMDLPASVAPFILRGVTLYGIDSVMQPREMRQQAWQRLAQLIDPALIGTVTRDIGLSEAIASARALLDGAVRGRVVVDVNR